MAGRRKSRSPREALRLQFASDDKEFAAVGRGRTERPNCSSLVIRARSQSAVTGPGRAELSGRGIRRHRGHAATASRRWRVRGEVRSIVGQSRYASACFLPAPMSDVSRPRTRTRFLRRTASSPRGTHDVLGYHFGANTTLTAGIVSAGQGALPEPSYAHPPRCCGRAR